MTTAVLGLSVILSGGCSTGETARLDAAAVEIGRLSADRAAPEWPSYCRDPMPAVVPKLGEKHRWTQARWELIREEENRRIAWCADHAVKGGFR